MLQWHVDDLTISHKNMTDIDVFPREFKHIYGDNLAECTGKQHNYLGMIFDFSFAMEVCINMIQHISKIN